MIPHDPYACIPPALRRTPTTPAQRASRRALALLGFLGLYIVLPLALIIGIYALNEMATIAADRADAFYQQTIVNKYSL